MDHCAGNERSAFEAIGRLLIEWGYLDRSIVRQTLLSRDREGKSAFFVGKIETGFYKRWNEWCAIHRPSCEPKRLAAFEAFHKHVHELSNRRDDLAHNVFDVHGYDRLEVGYSIGIEQLAIDWEPKFQRWRSVIAKMDPRDRPRAPLAQNNTFRVYPRHIENLRDAIRTAHESIEQASAARKSGGQFVPSSIPPLEWWT